MTLKLLLLVVVLGMGFPGSTSVRLKLTKLICNLTDPDFFHVDSCILKPESRYVQYLVLRGRVFQLPIRDFKIRIQVMKRLNGWKPFLYDFTVDCTFQSHLNKLTGFVWKHVRNVSNIQNIRCPLNQSLYQAERLDNKYLENALQVLPVPTGEYGAFITIIVEEKLRGELKVYGTIF